MPIFKTLAISKIIFQAFVTPILMYVVTKLEKYKKVFYRKILPQKLSTIHFVIITDTVG